MKIALIIRRLNVKGGAQRQILELARELKKRGHDVTLYTFLLSKEHCYADLMQDIDIAVLPDFNPPPEKREGVMRLFSYVRTVQYENNASKKLALIIDDDTDLLHPHDHVSYRVAAFFKKYKKNISSVWMMNDMPTRAWSFWRESQFRPELRLSLAKKIFYWLVDTYDALRFIALQDAIVVVDDRDRVWVKESFHKDASIVRCGLHIEHFRYRERSITKGQPLRILGIGILLVHRRFEDSIEAVRILRKEGYDGMLSIIGSRESDRKYAASLAEQVEKSGMNRYVAFQGDVTEDELMDSYNRHDVFVFPNHLQSWGLAVFEAMASGLPVIVSKSAGASEVLTDKKNALLVNPKSPREIAKAVQSLVDNPDLYRTLSKNGRDFVEQNISWGKYTDQMEEIFKKTMNKER
ncbi:MAG: glycosyltransferase family 4 protein [bacterium]|nr:glycosyltransferase family 4 protein [bacterium]